MTDKLVDPAWLDALLSLFCQQRALTAGQLNATTFRVLAELGRMRHRGRDEKNGGTESGTRQAGTGHRHAASLGGHSSGCGPDRAVIRHGKLQPGAGGSEAAGQPAL